MSINERCCPSNARRAMLFGFLGAVFFGKTGALAQSSDVVSIFERGMAAEAGASSEADFKEAAALYASAAARGHAPSKVALGYLHETGRGLPKDPGKAYELYREGAEAGDISASYYLALAYAQGIGVQVDLTKSATWLAKAAEAGDQKSQFMLAVLLASSKSDVSDFAARRWFARAEQGADPEISQTAAEARRRLDRKLLFSGAFRMEDVAGALLLSFGVAVLLAKVLPSGGQVPPAEYKPPRLVMLPGTAPSRRAQQALIYRAPVTTSIRRR